MGPSDADSAVTLIVVAYNHERFLPDLLSSIDEQIEPPAMVLLCDDRSSDGSASIMRNWAATTLVPSRVLPNTRNLGLNATLNHALSLVSTPLFAYISADDVMRPERLAAQVAQLSTTNSTFVYSDATVINAEGQPRVKYFISQFLGGNTPPIDTFESLLRIGNWIPAASVLLKTDAVRSVGGYDEDLFFEDYDLWLRLARNGTFTHVVEPLVSFRMVETSLGSTRFSDDDDDWQWAKVSIRAKHFGASRDADRVIADVIHPWLITLAARGHPRRELAPLFRRSAKAAPSMRALLWAATSSIPSSRVLAKMAASRRDSKGSVFA